MKIKSCNHYGFTTDERILICKECITSQLDEAVREAVTSDKSQGDSKDGDACTRAYDRGFASAIEKAAGIVWAEHSGTRCKCAARIRSLSPEK